MKIYLIRHAIAGDWTEWHRPDHLRPLTPKGAKKMVRVVDGLKNLGVSLDLIFSSPYVRAMQTAEIVADRLDFSGEIEELEILEPHGIPADMLPILDQIDEDASVAFVGHNPHMTLAVSYFVSADYYTPIVVKKGSVAAFEGYKPIRPQRLEFQWLLWPKHLVAIGGSS